MLRDVWWGCMDGKLLSTAYIIVEFADGQRQKYTYYMNASRTGMEMKEELYEASMEDCHKLGRVFEEDVEAVALACTKESLSARAHTPGEWVMEVYRELIRKDIMNNMGPMVLTHRPKPRR